MANHFIASILPLGDFWTDGSKPWDALYNFSVRYLLLQYKICSPAAPKGLFTGRKIPRSPHVFLSRENRLKFLKPLLKHCIATLSMLEAIPAKEPLACLEPST
jgi:hypothetical protein